MPATLHRPPTFFPFLFSPRYPHILSWIVICPLPLRSTPRPLLFFALVSVTTCPCHLIFHIRPTRDHRLPNVTNHISDLPIPAHLAFESCLVTSTHLTLTSPRLASILFRVPRTHLSAMCVKRLPRVLSVSPIAPSALDSQTFVQKDFSDLFVTVAPRLLSSI